MKTQAWKSALVLLCSFQTIQAWLLQCYLGSLNNTMAVSSHNITDLIGTPYLNLSQPTVIYTFGFLGKYSGPTTQSMLAAFFANYKSNLCLLNWEAEASSFYNYYGVVTASNEIGKQLAQALLKLKALGLDLLKVWLIGLSVGAHLMGDVGRALNASIGTITGLDPAYELYDGLATEKPLAKDCGVFVNIHHTSKVKYGMVSSTAHVDIFFNEEYYRKNGVQPGCPVGINIPFSTNDLCSHNRGAEYLIQSLSTPTELQARKAESYQVEKEANGTLKTEVIYVGPLINKNATGKFYINTNAKPPYGKGAKGL